MRTTIAALAVMVASGVAAHGQSAQTTDQNTTTLNLSAYAELLRSDLRTQKVAIIAQVMEFTEAEDTAFWPIYREYETEMARLGDERLALIAEYARKYDAMTDEIADQLGGRAIELDAKRRAVTARCYERVKTALSPRTAFRFLQVEHQLQLLIDLQISAGLPIVSKRSGT